MCVAADQDATRMAPGRTARLNLLTDCAPFLAPRMHIIHVTCCPA